MRQRKPEATDDELRLARVAVARRMWDEIPETRLVSRGLGLRLLVDAETDEVFTVVRGTVFENGSARLVDERKGLSFYLDSGGWPVALERYADSWSAIAYKRARAAS